MNIIVNGTRYGIISDDLNPEGKMSYSKIIGIAGRGTIHRERPTVTYTTDRFGDEQRQGELTPGNSVVVEEGMIFNVVNTGHA